jgi:large subunit ribosomal protein L3
MTTLLGRKLGMTRVFDANGRSIPVTAIEAGPCVVVRRKTAASDGYSAIAVGFGVAKHPNKPLQGQSKHLPAAPQHIQEFRVAEEESFDPGQPLDCASVAVGERLNITATSKGKGFSGVIKRHHFRRGPETHGSDHHRAPGSIGSMFPQHVRKGKRMAGRMGNAQVTVRKVQVVDIFPDKNIILVKGAVPGIHGSLVRLQSE